MTLLFFFFIIPRRQLLSSSTFAPAVHPLPLVPPTLTPTPHTHTPHPHPLYKIALINKLKLIATLNICQVLADFHHRLSRTFGGTIPGGFRRGWSASRLAVVVLVLVLLVVVVMVKGSGATTPTSRQRFSIFKPTLPFFAGCHSHRLC